MNKRLTAAESVQSSLIIDPPQKWLNAGKVRSEIWYGNCPSTAGAPPTIRL